MRGTGDEVLQGGAMTRARKRGTNQVLVDEAREGRRGGEGQCEIPRAGETTELRGELGQTARGELERHETNPLSDAEIADAEASGPGIVRDDARIAQTDLGTLRAGATTDAKDDWGVETKTESTEITAARFGNAEEGRSAALEQRDHGEAERRDET